MKKLIAFVIAAMMILSCFAALAESNGTLTMCTNAQFPPYEFYDTDGETIIGIDAEIAAAVCEKIGYELKIQDIDFDACIPGVKDHKYDFAAAGMTVTDERKEIVQFTDSYATGIQVIIVPEDSAYESIDDIIADKGTAKIGVQQATTGALYCTWDYEEAGLATVDAYKSGGAAVAALVAGKEDCVVIDNEPAKNFVAQNEGLKILETAYTTEDYAMAFAKDSEVFEAFNAALAELIADGTVAAIVEKYIPAEEAE